MSFRPITDTWLLARPKVPYYGAYPAGFLERARWMLPVLPTDPVLHVCAGRVRDYSSPDRGVKKGVPLRGFYANDLTVDLDGALNPDIQCDVSEPGWHEVVKMALEPHCGPGSLPPEHAQRLVYGRFRGILVDRPYTAEDARKYAVGDSKMPTMKVLMAGIHELLAPGGRVGVLDYVWPRPVPGLYPVAKIGVSCGFGNRDRCFSVFERR